MHAKNSPALVDGSCTHSSPSAAVIVSAALALATLSGCQSQQATNSPPVRDSNVAQADGTVTGTASSQAATPSLAMVANDQARREAEGLSKQLGLRIESLATTPEWYASASNDPARVGGTATSKTLSAAVQDALASANRSGAARGLDVKTMRVERAAYKRLPTGSYAAWAAMGDGSNMGELYAPIDLSETVVAQVPATESGTANSTTQATTTSEPTPPASTLPSLSQPRAAVQTAEGTPLAKAASSTTASSMPSAAPAAAAPASTSIAAQPTPQPTPQAPATSTLPTLANPSASVNSATGSTTPAQPATNVAAPAVAVVTPAAPSAPSAPPAPVAPVTPSSTPTSAQPPASTLPTLSNPGAKVNSATGEKPATQAVSQPAPQSASKPASTQAAAQPALPTLANPRAQVVSTPASPAAQSAPAATGASSVSTLPTLANPRANVSSTPVPASAGAPVVAGDSPLSPLAAALTDPNMPLWFTLRPLSKNGRTMIGVVTQAANAREATRLAITTGRDQLQAALGTPARELVTDKTKTVTLPDGQVKMYSLISCAGVLPVQPQ